MACKKCEQKKEIKKDEDIVVKQISTPFKITSLKGTKKVKTSSKITNL